jgi:hypothetical protein
VFLAIQGQYQPSDGDPKEPISTRELSEREFRDYAPRLSDIFLNVKPDYPERTVFVRLDLANGRTLLLVLEPPRRVVYAGVLPTSSAASKPVN